MSDEILKRDQNSVTVLAGVTDDANLEIVQLRLNPTTKRLKVSAVIADLDVGGGGTGLTTVAAGSILAAQTLDTLEAVTSVSGTKHLVNTDGVITWETFSGGGDVSKVGTPVDSQVGVWTGDGTIEGTSAFTYDGSNLQLTGDIGSTGTRITKGWFVDLQVTNAIAGSVTGNAATATALQTARTIGGVSFDGTGNITVASATGGFTITGTTTLDTGLTGVLRADSGVVSIDSDVTDIVAAATTSAAGKVELAINTEVNTGTDATRAVTPDALAGSVFGIRYMQAVLFNFTSSVTTGDGKYYFHIPPGLNGMNLVYVHAEVITAGTTNTTDIQIANVTQAADMLTTKLTIDSTETGSDTAAAAAVIDTSNDDVATNDVIRIDVDAVSTTPPQGLIVTLGFQLP